MQTLFTIGHVVLGLFFLMMGMMHFMKMKDMTAYARMKGLPMPSLSVVLTGMLLALGGAGVLFQVALVWSYGSLVAFLVSAAFLMHNFWAAKDAQSKMNDMVNFQKNLALAAALTMLLALQR
jgi:uncharacterized membrane protein YphA (DoxX/SURF4 family)